MRQDVESFDDFCQYYTGHFVKGRDDGMMYYVNGKLGANVVSLTPYTNGRKSKTAITIGWDAILTSVLFGLPRLGMMVYKNELLFLYYRTQRNGGRGFDPDRIETHSFNSWFLTKNSYPVYDGHLLREPHFAYLATRNAHTPFHDAIVDMLSDKPKAPAYALSFNFGVFSGHNANPTLVYKTKEIGEVLGLNLVKLQPWAFAYKDTLARTLGRDVEVVV